MIIPISGNFTGEFPRSNAELLPPTAAAYTTDCDFQYGSLKGLQKDQMVYGLNGRGVRSMFTYHLSAAQPTFTWNRDVSATLSPVVNDAYARFYWSDGSQMMVSNGNPTAFVGGEPPTKYKVGVPAPSVLSVSTVSFALPNISAAPTITLVDVLPDGSVANEYVVSSTPTTTASGMQYVFNARSPATATAATPSGTTFDQTVYQAKYAEYIVAGYDITEAVSKATADATETSAGSVGTIYEPMVIVEFTTDDGLSYTAKIREDSSKTSWPPQIAGVVGTLSVDTPVNGRANYTLTIAATADLQETRYYVYTYVNAYGEEGPPSAPIEALDCTESGTVSITLTKLSDTTYVSVGKARIYRTATGSGGTQFLYVDEVDFGSGSTVTYVDTKLVAELGEPISTENFYPPPQTLKGLCVMANGIVCGFRENEVWFSEPYLGYAYNPSYAKPLPFKVVSICPFEGGLYVTTTGNPYIIMGASPDTMTDAKVPAVQAGVSRNSLVNVGPYVVWASNDGLVMARGLDASLDTSFKFFTRETWRSLYGTKLSSMHINVHDGSLLVWFDDGTPGFLIRLEEEALSMTRLSLPYYAASAHPTADHLYVCDGSTIKAFRESSERTSCTWRSKQFITQAPTSFGVLQLVGSGTMALTIYADGSSVHTATVTLSDSGSTLVRLPSGFLARKWQFDLAGQGEVKEAYLATTISELKRV